MSIEPPKSKGMRDFLKTHFKHFNAAAVCDAAEGWVQHLEAGNKMFLAMAGAMSTAEIGLSLAEMIRREKIHAISTTGANLEEDIFNLVAHDQYERIPHFRELSVSDENELHKRGMNRVTDTCIPEESALRFIENHILEFWQQADRENRRLFPFEFMYELIRSNVLKQYYKIDPKHSWVVAASEMGIPIYTPGWEDSTLGNIFVSHALKGNLSSFNIIKTGLEQMSHLVQWYEQTTRDSSLGFFQLGGGIAGDFAICAVPLLIQDLKRDNIKRWSYYAQVSDSTTSFGSYSGAVPNEKITWGKLSPETPKYMIESDATIVAPLIFNYVLDQ